MGGRRSVDNVQSWQPGVGGRARHRRPTARRPSAPRSTRSAVTRPRYRAVSCPLRPRAATRCGDQEQEQPVEHTRRSGIAGCGRGGRRPGRAEGADWRRTLVVPSPDQDSEPESACRGCTVRPLGVASALRCHRGARRRRVSVDNHVDVAGQGRGVEGRGRPQPQPGRERRRDGDPRRRPARRRPGHDCLAGAASSLTGRTMAAAGFIGPRFRH